MVKYHFVKFFILLIVVFSDDEQLINRCIVQYHFTDDEHEVLVRLHGNSKNSEPYVRTMPSTFTRLNKAASDTTP